MAVNVGQRNVPDTPQNRQLEACQKAMDLCLHTIKICNNKNIFLEEYQNALTNDIIRCAKDIYIYAWDANNVYLAKDGSGREARLALQGRALQKCNELLALINVARRLFHLKGNKVRYWSGLTIETKKLIYKWREATK